LFTVHVNVNVYVSYLQLSKLSVRV